MDHLFDQATSYVPQLVNSLDSTTLLYFYARYKQATCGPCNTPKPGFFDFNGRKKWQAWYDLGTMSAEQAQTEYVDKLKEVAPSWKPDDSGKNRNVYVSRMPNLVPDTQPITPSAHVIFDLVKQNDLDSITTLLDQNPDEVNATDENKMTPLHWAADRGFTDIAQILIKRNACLDARDIEGQTPLHYACSCGQEHMIDLLLKSGARQDICDNDNKQPKDVLESDYLDMYKTFASNNVNKVQ